MQVYKLLVTIFFYNLRTGIFQVKPSLKTELTQNTFPLTFKKNLMQVRLWIPLDNWHNSLESTHNSCKLSKEHITSGC